MKRLIAIAIAIATPAHAFKGMPSNHPYVRCMVDNADLGYKAVNDPTARARRKCARLRPKLKGKAMAEMIGDIEEQIATLRDIQAGEGR